MIFEPGGRGRFVPASESFDDAFGRLVEIVVVAQASGDWRWLKACAGEGCRGGFLRFLGEPCRPVVLDAALRQPRFQALPTAV